MTKLWYVLLLILGGCASVTGCDDGRLPCEIKVHRLEGPGHRISPVDHFRPVP